MRDAILMPFFEAYDAQQGGSSVGHDIGSITFSPSGAPPVTIHASEPGELDRALDSPVTLTPTLTLTLN